MLFAIGSIGFWLLFSAISLLVIFAEEAERVGLALGGLIGAFVALALWGDFNVVKEAVENPALVAVLFAGYFVAGAVWSVIKWSFYVRDRRYRYEEDKMKFLRHHGVKGSKIPNVLLAAWKHRCEPAYTHDRHHPGTLAMVPQVHEHKARVMRWMMFWPWSVVWTIVNDPIKKLFKRIYRAIKSLLQHISDRTYRGIEDDFRKAPAPSGGGQVAELGVVDDVGDLETLSRSRDSDGNR